MVSHISSAEPVAAIEIGFDRVDGQWVQPDREDEMSGSDSGSDRIIFVYTTYPSVAEAEGAGRALVERRLAACVNILPGMISHYRWEGAIERGEETVMIIKTRAVLFDAVRAAVKSMHSYTTPAILVVPIEDIDPNYRAWLLAETDAKAG